MTTLISDNPKITFAAIKLQDVWEEQKSYIDHGSVGDSPHPDFIDIITHKEAVLKHYQPVFSPDRINGLTKAEFESFLLYRNNHHWDSLHRVGAYMVEDMPLLRKCLAILLDESRPVRDRINEIRPERYWGEHSMVSHLGTPVLTAILHVVFPEKYGVWNNTSDAGLKEVRLWDQRWEKEKAGNSYFEMNRIYLQLSTAVGVDLWTLDALWWLIKK